MIGSQIANPQKVALDSAYELSREEFCRSPARWNGALFYGQRGLGATFGAGSLRWCWKAIDRYVYGGEGAGSFFTETNIIPGEYYRTVNGGPFVDFDGATEWLHINDPAWAEMSAGNHGVWCWVNAQGTTGAHMGAVGKWSAGSPDWYLGYDNGLAVLKFVVYDSTAAASRTALSSHSFSTDEWYFLCGQYSLNNRVRVGVGAADDGELTFTDAGVMVTGHAATTSDLGIGALDTGPGNWWYGYVGLISHWRGIDISTVSGVDLGNQWMSELFHMTRYFYQA